MKKKTILAVACCALLTGSVLTACGSKVEKQLVGTWLGEEGSYIVMNEDKSAIVNDTARTEGAVWFVKDGYLYIDRETHVDLKAKLPAGSISGLMIESDSSGWRAEAFSKR